MQTDRALISRFSKPATRSPPASIVLPRRTSWRAAASRLSARSPAPRSDGSTGKRRNTRQRPSSRNSLRFYRSFGDIALKDGQPVVHAHLIVGRKDGTAHGGHL